MPPPGAHPEPSTRSATFRSVLPAPAPAHLSASSDWRSGLSGGVGAMVAALPVTLMLGVLGFGATGAAAPALGIPAAITALTLGCLLMAAMRVVAVPLLGPSTATTLILASLIARAVQAGTIDASTSQGLALALALAGGCVSVAGALIMTLGLLRLGRLARYVPQTVLAGFMNGVALRILVAQVPLLLGLGAAATLWEGLSQPQQWNLWPLGVGLLAALAVWLGGSRWPRLPLALIGLLLATGAHHLLLALAPTANAGAQVGALAAVMPGPTALAPWLGEAAPALWERHGVELLVSALLIALLVALESSLNARAVDQLADARHDPDRHLLAVGLANVASGLFGGLPLVLARYMGVASLRAGGRGVPVALVCAGAIVGVYVGGQWLLERVPLAALAGIMLTVAVGLIDGWSRQMLLQWWRGDPSRQLRVDLAVVGLVCAVTLLAGFVPAVALGVLLTMGLFIRRMNRSLLRSRYSATARHSRRLYPPVQDAALGELRQRIQVMELEGALFFGSIERLHDEIETLLREEPGLRVLVLDLRRISEIDASGALGMAQLQRMLGRHGVSLLLASVRGVRDHAARLTSLASFAPAVQRDWHDDADQAIEAAELQLLIEAGRAPEDSLHPRHVEGREPEMPLAQCALFDGLDEAQRAMVLPRVRRLELARGSTVFARDDAADALYLLLRGSVTVYAGNADAQGAQHRLVTIAPGMTFGETAVLDGGGRTGRAVTDRSCVLGELRAEDLRLIEATDAAAAARIYRNLALHASQRLRAAAAAWQDERS